MKKIFHLITVFCLLITYASHAQNIPETALENIIKSYTSRGMKLEKTYYPDFEKEHPNNTNLLTPCYPGKKLVIVTAVASQPEDWYFKAGYRNQLSPRSSTLTEKKIDGNTYWTDYMIASFPPEFNDQSDECQTVNAYDKNNMDLPVYIMIFTSTE